MCTVTHQHICLSVLSSASLSACLYNHLSAYLYTCTVIGQPICRSICQSICTVSYQPICRSVLSSIRLSVYPHCRLSVLSSVSLSICLSADLYIRRLISLSLCLLIRELQKTIILQLVCLSLCLFISEFLRASEESLHECTSMFPRSLTS